ncbi:PDZ domain containing ring finger 3-like protein [Leptotrombidium deliense]|uniref:PDZ domain containing ring finger 3-like protein n=1 Tax=Leptotrombidium deliense TaxID=299467 RepID=A0A443STU5_9ACAR|nr:PDZ domain containing ring finger 3-like protein [Leptotrombidium deliense]
MGVDLDLFNCRIPSNAKCSFCFKVIEDAVKIEHNNKECHVCKNCCIDYFEKQNNCEFEFGEINWQPADETVVATLESLTIKCPNIMYGCKAVIPMHTLSSHVQYCGWRPFKCRWNCGTVLALQKVRIHEESCDHKEDAVKQKTQQLQFDKYDERIDKLDLNRDSTENISKHNTCGESNEIICGVDDSKQQSDTNNGAVANNNVCVEAVVHRDIDGNEDKSLQTLKGQQQFGALYKKVCVWERNFVQFEEKLEKMNSEHTDDIKKLYNYSYELMQTLKSQTQQDLDEIRTQINIKKQQKKDRKTRNTMKHCMIQ